MRRRVSMKANAGSTINKAIQEAMAKQTTTRINKLVRFAPEVQVKIIDRVVDPEIKKALYYTRQDIFLFHKQLEAAIALQRQSKCAKELQSKTEEDQVYLDHLHEQKRNVDSSAKRSLPHANSASGLEISAKRQRSQTTPAA